MSLDAMATRPSSRPLLGRVVNESTRVMGMGKALPAGYEGLRRGTQLVCIGDDAWSAIGHEMQYAKQKEAVLATPGIRSTPGAR